ncbi:hypothetical protein ACIBSV_11620 [Embleya sp. NPDC050154]|uniref:hypothetical protein n=1 Tax=unclassified Embleya TaxID=2699296 RepID=UPI003799E397
MRARLIAVVAAAVAAVATLAPPAQAAPLGDGTYRFPALRDGKCLIWYKPVTSPGTVSLGACTETASTSPDWQVRRRPNGTMDISKAGSDPRRCMKVNDNHRLAVNDNCDADRYADWTVSYGTDKPGGIVYADIEHTPHDQSPSWGKVVDLPDVTGRIVVQAAPIEPHYWGLQQVGG